jgi:sugar/nucleoside kinase (ribokinase family)
MPITICGIGCSLVDCLYTDVSFESDAFRRYRSRADGDGGLSPGKLVFSEEIERFSGTDFDRIRNEITGGRPPQTSNLGGPSVVALIHASQLLADTGTSVRFFGARGSDPAGDAIMRILARTPLDTSGYRPTEGGSPYTVVFSDPAYDGGHGERTFVNYIGAAGNYSPKQVDESFFDGDILEFGGTALVPRIHDGIGSLLRRAKQMHRFTVVNTVYDFRSQKSHPQDRWPLGDSEAVFADIDLFIADLEEALRTTGTSSAVDALTFLREAGVGAAVVTEGARPVHLFAAGGNFDPIGATTLPVSELVSSRLRAGSASGDTTGCGDNFVGGVLASLVNQLRGGSGERLDLRRACSLGIVSGGHACSYVGGTYLESHTGEKRRLVAELYRDYLRQIDAPPDSGDLELLFDSRHGEPST